ncbi:MAG: zinc ribbon domain-containing protein [Kiritimatiellae bacterium]|nr:zinc ribbon domain-containing protein [Kiritimatiellia bacterium]
MPTYEYECAKCKHVFEKFQNITEKPLRQCPQCKGRVRRLIGRGAGIIFKGSGFYQTDYRSDHYRQRAAADKTSSAAPAAGAEAKKGAARKEKSAGHEKHAK